MVSVIKPELKGYQQNVKLLDGKEIVIRLITPKDREALKLFYSRLTGETRFMRFLFAKAELNESDLKDFCDGDYYDNLGLVAEQEREGQKEIIGVGRYFRLPSSPHTAEVAFVVQDSEQRKGIGTQLLKHLATLAWENDIYFFLGEMFRENGRMMSVFRKSDPEMYQVTDDDHTCQVKVSVAEAMYRSP